MFLGIDIGSTAAKAVLLAADGQTVLARELLPTGWSSADAALALREKLAAQGHSLAGARVVATGYGRVSVPYADAALTEISCHGRGVLRLFGRDCTVLDIGGQDTKLIRLENGKVRDFYMNDKCAAGTGRFLEVMANTLGLSLAELFALAQKGGGVRISSLCTVFAESEVIGMVGGGRQREDIAYGVCESIVEKVAALCARHGPAEVYYLSGGLCESAWLRRRLAETLKAELHSAPEARYAGALGAAILAREIEPKRS